MGTGEVGLSESEDVNVAHRFLKAKQHQQQQHGGPFGPTNNWEGIL
jgi:hypothetical protein